MCTNILEQGCSRGPLQPPRLARMPPDSTVRSGKWPTRQQGARKGAESERGAWHVPGFRAPGCPHVWDREAYLEHFWCLPVAAAPLDTPVPPDRALYPSPSGPGLVPDPCLSQCQSRSWVWLARRREGGRTPLGDGIGMVVGPDCAGG